MTIKDYSSSNQLVLHERVWYQIGAQPLLFVESAPVFNINNAMSRLGFYTRSHL